MKLTFIALFDRLRFEDDAREFLEELRWPKGVVCPTRHCSDVYLVVSHNGCPGRTAWGSMSERRTGNCREYRRLAARLGSRPPPLTGEKRATGCA